MGAMLLCTVMVAPQGFVIGVANVARRLFARRGATKPAAPSKLPEATTAEVRA